MGPRVHTIALDFEIRARCVHYGTGNQNLQYVQRSSIGEVNKKYRKTSFFAQRTFFSLCPLLFSLACFEI